MMPNKALTLATNAAVLESELYVRGQRVPFVRFDNPFESACPFHE